MKIDLYSSKGNKLTAKADLSDEVWGIPMNEDLIAQVLHVYHHNQRKGTAHTKTRSDVSGGGKKPWRQKGTGRARHGSIRSPLWVGGGVAFGPKSYKSLKSIPKKMLRKALSIMLSQRVRDESVRMMKDLSSITEGKTKEMVELLEGMKINNKKVLILLGSDVKTSRIVKQAGRNIEKLYVMRGVDVHPYNVLDAELLLVTEAAKDDIEKRIISKKQ